MNDKNNVKIIDNYKNHYDRLCNLSSFYNTINYDFIKNYLPGKFDSPMIDIGCGQGQLLSWLYKTGYTNIIGIDNSQSQINEAIVKLPPEIKVIYGEVSSFIKGESNAYMMIFIFDVIEHFKKEEILEFASNLHKSLKPGGGIIIRTPNMANPLGIYSRYNDFTHQIGFTEYSLIQVLENSGFKDITIIPMPPGSLKLRILRSIYQKFLRIIYKIELRSIPRVLDSNITVYARKN